MLKIMPKTMLSLSSTGIRYDKLDLTPEHCMKAPIEDWMFMCSIGLVILKVIVNMGHSVCPFLFVCFQFCPMVLKFKSKETQLQEDHLLDGCVTSAMKEM